MWMRGVLLMAAVTIALAAAACGDGSDGKQTQQPEPACAPSATYTACRSARSETDCRAAGGDWRPGGISQDPICHCPTGQGSCPCSADDSPCVDRCVVLSGGACDRLAQGTCTDVTPSFGCYCTLDFGWGPGVLCAD